MSKAVQQGIAFHKQGRLEEAERHYIEALNEFFDNQEALYLLGTVYFQQGRSGIAAQLFLRSLQLNPKHFESLNNLGNCYKNVNKEAEARSHFERALHVKGKSNQEYADIWNNLSTLYINAGNPKEGVRYAKKALELKPDHADANWNYALMMLEQGQYAEGFDKYEWGFKTKNRLFRSYGNDVPVWDGSKGKIVVVWGEQGIGDEILFASMIPDLIRDSKQVIFECHPRLVNLFKHSFPGLAIYGTRKDTYINWVHNHSNMEAKIAIGDLGRYYRRQVADFPKHEGYLKPNPERAIHYKKKLAKLGNKLKVGISWTGGYVKTRKDFRSIPLELWEPILRQDADFISLQYTPEAYNSIADIEDRLDVKIHHWPSAVQNTDYAEAAALVSELDLIITVNTSIHHLAGALGKECWTLTPKGKAWRYWSPDTDNSTIPWYPACRQYQQENSGDWLKILSNITKDLEARLCV